MQSACRQNVIRMKSECNQNVAERNWYIIRIGWYAIESFTLFCLFIFLSFHIFVFSYFYFSVFSSLCLFVFLTLMVVFNALCGDGIGLVVWMVIIGPRYSKSTFGANNYLLFNHNVHQIKQIFSCFLYIFKLNTLFHFSLHVFKSNRYFIVQLIFSRVSQKLFLFLTFSR